MSPELTYLFSYRSDPSILCANDEDKNKENIQHRYIYIYTQQDSNYTFSGFVCMCAVSLCAWTWQGEGAVNIHPLFPKKQLQAASSQFVHWLCLLHYACYAMLLRHTDIHFLAMLAKRETL